MVVSYWRVIPAEKLFGEAPRNESLADVLPFDRQQPGNSDVGIKRYQRRIAQGSRAGM